MNYILYKNRETKFGALIGGLNPCRLHMGPKQTHLALIGPSWTLPLTPPGWNCGRSNKSAADSDGLYGGSTWVQLSTVDF